MTAPARNMRQGDGALTIWLSRPDPARADLLLPLVSAAEVRGCQRFRFPADRAACLISHALRRRALSGLLDQPASGLRFGRSPEGRSFLDHPGSRMLISSTRRRGLVGFVAAELEFLGLDLEEIRPVSRRRDLLARFLDPGSLALLDAPGLGPEEGRFAQLWSITEACAKARGTGLTDDLRLQISLSEPGEAMVRDGANRWRCLLFAPDPAHRLTLAVGAGSPVTAELRDVLLP